MIMNGVGSPRVEELFKELNKTLENPDSETKQTVRGVSYIRMHIFISKLLTFV